MTVTIVLETGKLSPKKCDQLLQLAYWEPNFNRGPI